MYHFTDTHVRFTQKHFMKFVNILLFSNPNLTPNPNPNTKPNPYRNPNTNPKPNTNPYAKPKLNPRISYSFNKVIILQSKDSTEKRKTVLISNYTWTYIQHQCIISEKHMSVSHKSISCNSYIFFFF